MTSLHPLRSLCAEHGVFLRGEAVALGFDDASLRRGLRAGELVRVRHGAYTFSDPWRASDERGKHLTLMRAVSRSHSDQIAFSHHSASVLHGFDLWEVPLDRVHLTRLDAGSGRRARDVVHHEGLWLPEDVVQREGLSLVRPERAALESASLLDVEHGLALVDSGLRSGAFSRDELDVQAQLMDSWPSSQHLQIVVRLADGRRASVGESRASHLFWSMGLPAPELQYPVFDGGELVGITDFAWPEYGLLGEFDGRVKYGRYLRPGEDPGDAVFREKQREDRIRQITGWRFIRLTWVMLACPLETAALVRSMLRQAA